MFLRNWLSNGPRTTLACVLASALCLALSLCGCLKEALPFDIAWCAIVLCGAPILVEAATALVKDFNIKADILASIALIASVFMKEYFAAGEVALIMQIGSLLEDFTAGRARKGIEKLIKLTPKTACIKRGGEYRTVAVEEVVAGDLVSVQAGETIPVDGVLLSGATSVDQSSLTGESMPVDKKPGDALISGTMNQYGAFEMRACKCSGDSSLQRMIALARQADAEKAPIVGLADRWAGWLVLAALACAVMVWLATGQFIRAVTILVVFCPCAFILATPTAIAAAIGNATGSGILVRTGDALERLAHVDCIAFDKTGTLTIGKPRVIGITPFRAGMEAAAVLRLAALAEQHSEHPLGKAICGFFAEQNGRLEEVSDVRVTAGAGITAMLHGRSVFVGKFPLDAAGSADAAVHAYRAKGATVVGVWLEKALCGVIALADTPRECARETMEEIKALAISPILLTGDNPSAAASIAESLGISEARSNLLPEDKMRCIREKAAAGKKICMVGDGVNDALALRAAFAGIAMGGVGSDIAIESADAVLVGGDIRALPRLFLLARRAMRKIRENILFSLFINFTAVLFSAFGLLNPVLAALVHNFGSVFVVVNAALLLTRR